MKSATHVAPQNYAAEPRAVDAAKAAAIAANRFGRDPCLFCLPSCEFCLPSCERLGFLGSFRLDLRIYHPRHDGRDRYRQDHKPVLDNGGYDKK